MYVLSLGTLERFSLEGYLSVHTYWFCIVALYDWLEKTRAPFFIQSEEKLEVP